MKYVVKKGYLFSQTAYLFRLLGAVNHLVADIDVADSGMSSRNSRTASRFHQTPETDATAAQIA